MSTSLLESQAINENPYLAQLNEVPDSIRKVCTWLVLTHADPLLLVKIRDAMGEEPAVILEIPQGNWELDREQWMPAIQELLANSAILKLVLVGHSQGNTTQQAAQLPSSVRTTEKRGDSHSGDLYQTLKARVQVAQELLDQAKQEVVRQYDFLVDHTSLAAVDGQPRDVHALFYMADSGLFLSYDPARKCFECES